MARRALRHEPAHYSSEAVRPLKPTATAEVLDMNLRDLFELSTPGEYRVDVAIDGLQPREGTTGVLAGTFLLEFLPGRN